MTIKQLYELALKKKYDLVLDELEKMPPRALIEFADEFRKHNKYAGSEFLDHLSDEQYDRFKQLGSTQRERNYLMSIPDEKKTEQDWADLRATDF